MFKNFWINNKDKPLFKGKVLAVIVIVVAALVNFAYKGEEYEKNTSSETASASEQDNKKGWEINIGGTNIAALCICIAALAAVKIKQENDLNGRHDKIEKNNKEEE